MLSGDVHSPTTLFEFGHYITCMTMDYYISNERFVTNIF